MNNLQLRIFPFLIFAFFLCSCHSYKHPDFSKKDVRKAQKMIGLDFSKDAIDTMYHYLGRNTDGYDTLRKYQLNNETSPALIFDPHPDGFNIPKDQDSLNWSQIPQTDLPEDLDQLAYFSIRQLADLIKSRKITSEALTKIFIGRIRKYDSSLHSVTEITEQLAISQARRADEEIAAGNYKGLLHGIPYGVKDLIAVKGYKTTWGAEPYKNQMIDYTASVIQKLDKSGAVLIAKLSSGALARGDVWYGGKTKNPWDITQGASGSSAGPGAATAAGLVAFSLGTETLGSIVSPSNRCGLTGLRPTYGRVSRYGVMSLSWSMDKVGPMCKNADDCAIVFEAIRGIDEKDRTTKKAAFNYKTSEKKLADLRVGYLKEAFDRDSTVTGKNNQKALKTLTSLGLHPEAVSFPDNFPFAVFDIILRAESGAFFDELVRSNKVDKMVQQNQRSRANSLRQSRFIPAVEYLQANRHRKILIEKIHEIFQNYDLIISPTFGGRQLMITNLTGHPALAVPTGFDDNGRPTSVTFLGNLYEEGILLEVADSFQQQTNYEGQVPPGF